MTDNSVSDDVRIIGVDPGSITTGWGIIDSSYYGRKLNLVSYGLINAKKNIYPSNLQTIFEGLKKAMEEFNPQIMVLESVFSGVNQSSLIKLSQSRGVVCLLASMFNIPLKEYAPRFIKKNIAGFGSADKDQVRHMVSKFLNHNSILSPAAHFNNINMVNREAINNNTNEKHPAFNAVNNNQRVNAYVKEAHIKNKLINNNISDALAIAICCATDMTNYIDMSAH